MEVKRPVILFLGSYIVGIIIAYNSVPMLFKLLIGVIAIFLYTKYILYGKISLKVMFIIIIIFLAGFFRFRQVEKKYDTYTLRVLELGKGNKEISGRVASIGKSTNSNYYILENASSAGLDLGRARVYFGDEINSDVKIGNYIKVSAGTSVIDSPSNEGEFNQKNYYRSSDIAFIAYANDIEVINSEYDFLKEKVYEIKVLIKNQILKIFDYKDAGLFKAMITGDRSSIDKEQKKTFSENGIAHIIAISGLHLSILGLMLFEFLRKFFSVNVSATFTSIFIFLYGIFIDASATSLRAISMLYVRFLSLAIGRTYDSKNTLYIICFMFLIMNPYLIFNAGFQFSYVAIFALNADVYIKKKKPLKVPAIIILNLFLFPITVYHYFTYPLYSVLLNLFVIPLMPFVLLFGILGLTISFAYLPLGVLVVKIIHIMFLIYDTLCMLIEKMPYHIVFIGRPTLYEVLYYYVALFLIIYSLENLYIVPKLKRSMIKNLEKINEFRKKIIAYRFTNIIRLSICFILLIMSILIISIRVKNDLRMTFLSIGQGDSILIEAKDKVYTVDGGSTSNTRNGEYILSPHIKSRAIDHIDYAFITHADSDHTNGMIYLLTDEDDINIYNLVLPINAKTDNKFSKLKSAAVNRGTKVLYMKETDILAFDNNLTIDVLSPDTLSLSNKKMDQNELSLTFKLEFNNHSCLFTGDIGRITMDRMINDAYSKEHMNSDVLKIPHHGSKNSNVQEFFDIVKPKLAVVSYGKNNNYGHPDDKTIQAINDTGAYVLKTGESGQIDVYFDKDDIYYRTFR